MPALIEKAQQCAFSLFPIVLTAVKAIHFCCAKTATLDSAAPTEPNVRSGIIYLPGPSPAKYFRRERA